MSLKRPRLEREIHDSWETTNIDKFPSQKKRVSGLEISFELRKRGWTQTRIARTLGVTQSAVHQIIFDRARSKRIRNFIASILQKEVIDLWRDRPKRFYH